MVLSFYRRGMCEQGEACVEFESGCVGCRQLLLGFEEDRVCVVREVLRQGCIGGCRPWAAAERRVWPGGSKAEKLQGGGAELVDSSPGDCA